jgi:hypothetical protein
MFSDLPAILAFNRADERTQIVVSQLTGFSPDKVFGDALVQGRQANRPPADLSRIQLLRNHAPIPPFV